MVCYMEWGMFRWQDVGSWRLAMEKVNKNAANFFVHVQSKNSKTRILKCLPIYIKLLVFIIENGGDRSQF